MQSWAGPLEPCDPHYGPVFVTEMNSVNKWIECLFLTMLHLAISTAQAQVCILPWQKTVQLAPHKIAIH